MDKHAQRRRTGDVILMEHYKKALACSQQCTGISCVRDIIGISDEDIMKPDRSLTVKKKSDCRSRYTRKKQYPPPL
jgi:hypothetical protein